MFERREALLDEALELIFACGLESEVIGNVASKPGCAATRSALIDEDQIAIAAHLLERGARLEVKVHRALPRAARDDQ